jgi:hypothetical protein
MNVGFVAFLLALPAAPDITALASVNITAEY